MDPFIAQLTDVCRAHPAAAKWVFVPGHAVGHTLGERLALQGVNWANVRLTTPRDVALRMAAPSLVGRTIDPSPEGLGPALVMRLLLELPPDTPEYFRPLAEQPKMADALWQAIRELRMAGCAAADLPAAAFASAGKHAELQALLRAYEEHLAAHRLADTAALYQEALRHPELCPLLPHDVWTELPGVIWAPLERRFLEALSGTRLTPAELELPGLEIPRRLALLGGVRRRLGPAPGSDADRLRFLLKPEAAPPPVRDETVSMFRAGGAEAEVEAVLRRILTAGVPFDATEIACAHPDLAALVWEKAQRLEWPVTVAQGIAVAVTRPGRALLAYCDWIEGGLAAASLRRLLQSGDIRMEIAGGPTAGQAARLLAESGATWGWETYGAALGALAASYREGAEDIEADDETRARQSQRAGRAARLGEWIHGLLALVPGDSPEARLPVGEVLAACGAFLESSAAVAGALDGAGAAAIAGALDELRALSDLRPPLRETLALLRDRVAGLRVGGDRARPGHLHVTALARTGYAGRTQTFVLGLAEGGVFPPLIEDPVLLDAERERISELLPTSRDRASEALHAVVSRLAALGGRVCLSFSCRDLRESRETFPSWLLLQVLRLRTPGRDLTYRDLDAVLGEPASAVPAAPPEALNDAGWWLAHLREAGRDALPAVCGAFPALVRGQAAEAARASAGFTAYDGLVPGAGPRLDPRASGRPVSPTRLEGLAACPFRYFLEYGLSLEPVEDMEPEPDQWLDPRTRGAALHALYAAILREARAAGERLDPGRHGARLRALGEAKLGELRALIPPPSDRIFEHERTAFLRDLDVFLALEAASEGRTPEGFEVSFGAGPAEGEPLARAEPIPIELGDGPRFLLRGRIDRIDRLADGTYEVVDYKTGRAFLPGGLFATFAGGRQLQHALYALAATQLLRARDPAARVTSAAYYFPTTRGGGQRPRRPRADAGAVAAVLRDLFDLLAAGAFVHTTKEDDCRFCQFQRACGSDPVRRAKAKVNQDPVPAALEAYRRLAGHA